ncbi:unnamed protein product [Symbiodinium sp. CCMP2592]|nr:unnamed protein product [Symbiodinium sp. CCMP2592]
MISKRRQAQRKLRKDVREGNDGTGEEEEEKEAKPTKSKPKAKSKAKARAKSKAVPEVKENKEDVLSEAEELDREEYAIKNQLRQEDDEDAQQGKQTAANKKKGKKKKKQAAAAAEHDAPVCGKEDDAADEVDLKGAKRRLDFEACLGDDAPGEAEPSVSNGMEEANGASAVGRAKKKLKRKIRKKGLRKAEQDVARTPAKEKEKHEEAADDECKADEEPAGMLVRPHQPTGWTPKLAKPKKKAKKFDDTNPMSKSRQQLEAKKDSIIKDLRQLRVLDNAMVLPTDFKDIASFTINPSPKVKEQEGPAGSTSIGALSGRFYVKPVPKARLDAINLHSPAEHQLKANNSDGVNVSWNKGNLADLQDWKQATEEDPGVSAEVLQDNIEQNSEIIHKKLDSGPRLLLQQGKALSDQSWASPGSSTWSDASWARPWTGEDWWSSGWDDQWSSWSWGRDDSSWSSWPSSGDDDKWKKPRSTDDDAAVPKDESAKSAADRVQALLQRGHTIDQLSTEDLKQIVQQIDKSKQGAADGQAEKPRTGDAENKEQGEGKEEKEGKRKDETKEERRERLHARNMRYYRSFESAMCPREISKLSKKASDDAGMRSYLFESWLSSGENWQKSSLLSRLRSKKSATARGFRKWMLRKEMVEKWGEEMADDMIEAKMSCEEKRMTEIRNWPECPKREVKQYLCLFEDSAEDVDHTELEMVLEAKAEASSSSSSSSKKKKKSKKKAKKSKKTKKHSSSPSPKKPSKGEGKGKNKQKKAKAGAKELSPEEEQEVKANASKAASKVKQEQAVDGMWAKILQDARAELQSAVDHDQVEAMADATTRLTAETAKFETIHKVPSEVEVTLYEGFEGDRKEVQMTIPVLDPHEVLDYVQSELKLECPKTHVSGFWKHLRENGNDFAKKFPGDLQQMTPFTIYGDELTLGKDPKDKVTGIFLQLTLFKPKQARQGIWLLAAIQDSTMVHDQLKTLTPILEHIVWSCNQACIGSYPTVSRRGSALTGLKAKKAGQKFSGDARWVCAELRGDWKWHERTLRLLRTPTSKKCPFTLLTGFDISMVKFCSMHVCNLGLVHTASGGVKEVLLREGHFGPYNGPDADCLKPLLECAYNEFVQWRRANRIACSQKSFTPRHLMKKAHGYYLTTKAYNARVVMVWLSAKLQEIVQQNAAATPSIRLHATALTAFANWFSGTEAAKRYLTPRQSDETYANGMVFLKCHLKLTQLSHQQKIVSWILKPKFHAMLHLLEQSHKWRYNTRYSHCFAGEDSMGWLKRENGDKDGTDDLAVIMICCHVDLQMNVCFQKLGC